MNRSYYEMNKLENGQFESASNLDYLIIAAGNTKRAYKVLNQLNKINIKNVIVVDFIERREYSEEYLNSYYSYKEMPFKFNTIDANINNPSDLLKSFTRLGINISSDDNIGFDITCFSRPYIFSILKYFQKVIQVSSVNVFYSEPKSYVFKDGNCKSYKSSSGPIRIIELPTYTGSNSRDNEHILVVLLGFDGDLSKEISFEVSPKEIFLLNGFPGFSPKFKDISLINNEILTSNSNNEILYCRANNPFDTYNRLAEIYSKKSNSFIVNLAPIGPKPMVLGACLFALHNPSIRVVYPQPEKYLNEESTNEAWRSWYYDLKIKLQN